MTVYWPNYYKNFRCTAGSCLHTCCAGWEIGIDKDSIGSFMADPEIADKIKDGGFILREDGRCPFLRDDNLCEMIVKHGEDYLCEICREHPRFYNKFDDHVEAGIGLVCEEACKLILENENGFELVAEDGTKRELPDLVFPLHAAPEHLLQIAKQDEHVVVILVFIPETGIRLQKSRFTHQVSPVPQDLFPHKIVPGKSGPMAGHVPDR